MELRRLRADLHIHTCLSPCGELAMSPRAVVEAARAAGLDLIAVTDHNMIRTLPQNRPHTGVQKLLLNLFPCKAERGGTAEIDLFRSLLPDHHLGKHSLLTTDNFPDHAAYR